MNWDPFAPPPPVRGAERVELCPADPPFKFTPARRAALLKAKRASQAGERNPNAKLNATTVKRIRIAHAAGARPIDLARRYNVERTLIWYIVTRRNWAHVD